MPISGKLSVGYDATAGNVTPDTGPGNYEDLSSIGRQQIIIGLKLQLASIFSAPYPTPPPLTYYDTWNALTTIPSVYADQPAWVQTQLNDANGNPANEYGVGPTDAIRYVQNGNQIICEHYFPVSENAVPFKLTQTYDDGAGHKGSIEVTIFAVIAH